MLVPNTTWWREQYDLAEEWSPGCVGVLDPATAPPWPCKDALAEESWLTGRRAFVSALVPTVLAPAAGSPWPAFAPPSTG